MMAGAAPEAAGGKFTTVSYVYVQSFSSYDAYSRRWYLASSLERPPKPSPVASQNGTVKVS